MLALKLTLVPLFLLLVTLVARRFGPRVAGWFAGLPLVTGPILGFIAFEQGAAFGAAAANAALAGVASAVAFNLGYAHRALRGPWPQALTAAIGAWALAVVLLSGLLSIVPMSLMLSAAIAAIALWLGPRLSPLVPAINRGAPPDAREIGWRMAAGAVLTLAVTLAAAAVGPRWSGLLAVFPLLSTVIAVFTQRREGAAYIAAMLRSLLSGLVAFAAFCAVLAVLLGRAAGEPSAPLAASPVDADSPGLALAFVGATLACLLVQAASGWWLQRRAT